MPAHVEGRDAAEVGEEVRGKGFEVITLGRMVWEDVDVICVWVGTRERSALWTYDWTSTDKLVKI
jgi:hypothetical protein